MKNHSLNTVMVNPFTVPNEEALSILLNNLDEIFLLVNKQLQIIHTTGSTKENVKKYFGIDITNETSILELVEMKRRPLMAELYKDVFNGIERETIVEIDKDGKPAIFETSFKPAKNSSGEIIGAVVISKDITEKKKAENDLKETEERWRFALEGGNQGVWDWNVQSGEIFFSDSYKRLYGYGDDDLQGRIEEWEKMVHPEDKERMKAAVDQHLSGTDPYLESIYRVKTKDGNYKWVLGRGMLLRDENQKPLRMIGTHTDITKQITAEQTYKVLFYSNPLPMWTYDLDTLRFVSVNDAAIHHYGYSKEEFLSMTLKDIRPEEEVDLLVEWVKSRRGLGHLKRTSHHLKKNGEVITVELTTHRLEDTNTVLVVAQDVTSKMHAEEELKRSNERFVLASRASSDAIFDWDLATNQAHWGEGLQTLFGFNPREVSITAWENLVHPDDRGRVGGSIRFSLEHPKGTLWKEEYRFAKADGSFSHVLGRAFIIRDEHQKAVRMIGSMQDITERKYAEQILSLERSVFELSTKTDADLKFLVETLLRGFEQIHEDAYSSLILLRDDDTIEPFVTPRLPERYTEKLFGLKIGPDEGSCGSAMWRKQTIIVEDISTHPFWEKYKELALHFGLQSCWSIPIIHTSGKVMGSFATYYKKVKTPSQLELNTLERIRTIIRILMEHHWSLNEIKRANERFDITMKATHDLIWDWDLRANIVYRSGLGLEKVYGIKDNRSIEKMEQWLLHLHPEDSEKVQKIINAILEDNEAGTFDVEYRFRRDDGTYSYVYDRGMIVRDKEGKPERVIGAAQDITERKNLEEELLYTELEKQKAINQATIDSQELERSEIGKELHDNINQILTTTKLYLDLALSKSELKDELIAKSNRNIISVINEIRQLSRSLMDPTIGDLGLIDSLHDLIENINLTGKLHVSLVAEKKLESILSKNYKLTIFRIIQEALNNAIKHAHATGVELCFRLRGNMLTVTIKDDGIGFDPLTVKMGAGLKNIQNRIYLVNGTYTIRTSPQKGCKIIINFPIIK